MFVFFIDQHFERVIHSHFVIIVMKRYIGATGSSIAFLQLVQNVAALLLTGTRMFEHITPILASILRLPIGFRVHSNPNLKWSCSS